MRFNKYSLLTAPAALLMFLSAGGGAIANTAQAKARKPRTTAVKKSHARKSTRKAKAAKKTPWNNSWAKVQNGRTMYFNVRNFNNGFLRARNRWLKRTPGNARIDPTRKTWNQFYQRHQNNKHLFTNFAKTFPGYARIEGSEHNVNAQRLNHTYDLTIPEDYGHFSGSNLDRTRNSELLNNNKLHGFTPHMINSLHRYEIPATNGEADLTSFHKMMRKTNNHPSFKLGNVNYIYSPNQGIFVQQNGVNQYGNAYRFNAKTNRYQKVNLNKANKKINSKRGQIQKEIDTTVKNNMTNAAHNSAFSKDTQNKLQNAMKQSGSKSQSRTAQALSQFFNGPAAGYEALSKDTDLTADQRAQASKLAAQYSKQTQGNLSSAIAKQIQNTEDGSKNVTFPMTLTQRYDVMTLYMRGAFDGMARNNAINLARFLVKNPALMNAYLAEYNISAQPHFANDADQLAQDANQKASNNEKGAAANNHNGLITSNKGLFNNESMLKAEALQLAKAQGIKL